jgi:cytochrome c oxidase cbb3-type subunit 4
MDINDLRAIVTVLSFIAFAGICWWAFSSKRTAAFDEAARLPLDDDLPIETSKQEQRDKP